MTHWTEGFWNRLPDFLSALLFLVVSWLLIGRIVRLIEHYILRRALSSTLGSFLQSFVSVALKIVVLITAAGIAGFEVTSLVTLIGAASLAIGLSLQGELQNFAGGVMLLVFKPFEKEDYIQVGQHVGKVEDIQMFNTKLRTSESYQVILPNKMLSNEVITNYSKSDEVKLRLTITRDLKDFDYQSLHLQCKGIILDLFRSGLILSENFELKLSKVESNFVHSTLSLISTRSKLDDVTHDFWKQMLGLQK